MLSYYYLILGCLLPLALAASGNMCRNKPYVKMQQFANYQPAQDYCWENYAGITYTTTMNPPDERRTKTKTCTRYTYTTVTSTKTRCTTTTTSKTCPAPTTPPPMTSGRGGRGSGRRVMARVTGVDAIEKRADPLARPWASVLAEMMQCGHQCFGTGCSCIETARTSTVKPRETNDVGGRVANKIRSDGPVADEPEPTILLPQRFPPRPAPLQGK